MLTSELTVRVDAAGEISHNKCMSVIVGSKRITIPFPATGSRQIRLNGSWSSVLLVLVALLVSGLMLLTPIHLVLRALELGTGALDVLFKVSTVEAFGRTALLAATVTLGSAVVAVPLAWLTTANRSARTALLVCRHCTAARFAQLRRRLSVYFDLRPGRHVAGYACAAGNYPLAVSLRFLRRICRTDITQLSVYPAQRPRCFTVDWIRHWSKQHAASVTRHDRRFGASHCRIYVPPSSLAVC